jgi:hypothetical protein
VGGKTPLSAGLLLAYDTVKREIRLHPDIMPMIILLTDGAGNVSMSGAASPQEESHRIAQHDPRRAHPHRDDQHGARTPSIRGWRINWRNRWAVRVIRWRSSAPIRCWKPCAQEMDAGR